MEHAVWHRLARSGASNGHPNSLRRCLGSRRHSAVSTSPSVSVKPTRKEVVPNDRSTGQTVRICRLHLPVLRMGKLFDRLTLVAHVLRATGMHRTARNECAIKGSTSPIHLR